MKGSRGNRLMKHNWDDGMTTAGLSAVSFSCLLNCSYFDVHVFGLLRSFQRLFGVSVGLSDVRLTPSKQEAHVL